MFVAVMPVAALAQTSTPAAQVTTPVTILQSMAQPQITDATRPENGFARVRFVNAATAPAVEVDFTLSSNGEALQTFADKGSFAPGAVVDHTFATDEVERDLQVSVAAVKFADGTVWMNTAPLPLGQRAVHDWMTNPGEI